MTLHHTVPGATGGWLALVRGPGALLLRPGSIAAGDLYEALGEDDPVRSTVELLTSGGFAATPDFALVVRSSTGPLHVVVRGPVEVRLSDGAVSGAEVSTWTERVVADGDYAITAPAEAVTPGADETAVLPLADGAAWATGLSTVGAAVEDAAAENLAGGVSRPTPPDDTISEETVVGAADAAAEAEASGVVEDTVLTAAEPSVDPSAGSGTKSADGEPTAPEDTVVPEETMVRPSEGEREGSTAPLPDLPPESQDAGTAVDVAADGAVDDATIVRPTDLPMVEPPAATPAEPPSGDHDGMTVLSSDVEGLAERQRPADDEIARPAETPGYVVVLPDGTREPLDGEMLVGRSPSGRVTGGSTPRLVTLAGDPDLSRTHVRIALEGDTVVVTDMHSRNGTTLQLAGKSPQLLRAGEPATVIPGTVVDLGGGTVLRIEASG